LNILNFKPISKSEVKMDFEITSELLDGVEFTPIESSNDPAALLAALSDSNDKKETTPILSSNDPAILLAALS
jgi:hypothetical protein